MIATNNIDTFYRIFYRLLEQGKKPKWYGKTYGNCHVLFITKPSEV